MPRKSARPKMRWEMTLDELIVDSGWFKGTMRDWEKLSSEERKETAFAAIGCEVAWPTWDTDPCAHLMCRIRRGELPRIAETNSTLRAERSSGWLRFMEDRKRVASIFRAYRKAARETGVYDPWKLDWKLMVYAGVGA